MRPRHSKRQMARTQANAELCGLTLDEWTALTRMERRRWLAAAKKESRDTRAHP